MPCLLLLLCNVSFNDSADSSLCCPGRLEYLWGLITSGGSNNRYFPTDNTFVLSIELLPPPIDQCSKTSRRRAICPMPLLFAQRSFVRTRRGIRDWIGQIFQCWERPRRDLYCRRQTRMRE